MKFLPVEGILCMSISTSSFHPPRPLTLPACALSPLLPQPFWGKRDCSILKHTPSVRTLPFEPPIRLKAGPLGPCRGDGAEQEPCAMGTCSKTYSRPNS